MTFSVRHSRMSCSPNSSLSANNYGRQATRNGRRNCVVAATVSRIQRSIVVRCFFGQPDRTERFCNFRASSVFDTFIRRTGSAGP